MLVEVQDFIKQIKFCCSCTDIWYFGGGSVVVVVAVAVVGGSGGSGGEGDNFGRGGDGSDGLTTAALAGIE